MKCQNIDLTKTPSVQKVCRTATTRAINAWKEQGLDRALIVHIVSHPHPGIPPSFLTDAEKGILADIIGSEGFPIKAIDGIRRDGKINVLLE